MTVGEWLARAEPSPPDALREHLARTLGAAASRDVAEAPDVLLGAAERLVAELLRENCTTRESALDLLTADALVTFAFEAAADRPADLAQRAAEAMRRMAALGASDAAEATQ